jgi:nucleoid DNA-binding protein
MPIPPDLHEDADYRALVEALAREGLPRRAEATRAVEAVMCALAQRLSHPDFDAVRDLLPEPFKTRLAACERHALAPRARFDAVEDFYEVVAEDLDRSPDEVEATVRAVFAAVRAQLAEQDAEDVACQLPRELDALWRRPS